MGKGLLFHMEISRPSLLLASCLLPSSTVWHFHISPPRAQAHAFLIQLYFLLQIHSAVASLPHFISYQHSILSPRYVCKCFILCSPMAVSDLLKSPYHHVKGSWERIKVVGHLSSWNENRPAGASLPKPPSTHIITNVQVKKTEIGSTQKKTHSKHLRPEKYWLQVPVTLGCYVSIHTLIQYFHMLKCL